MTNVISPYYYFLTAEFIEQLEDLLSLYYSIKTGYYPVSDVSVSPNIRKRKLDKSEIEDIINEGYNLSSNDCLVFPNERDILSAFKNVEPTKLKFIGIVNEFEPYSDGYLFNKEEQNETERLIIEGLLNKYQNIKFPDINNCRLNLRSLSDVGVLILPFELTREYIKANGDLLEYENPNRDLKQIELNTYSTLLISMCNYINTNYNDICVCFYGDTNNLLSSIESIAGLNTPLIFHSDTFYDLIEQVGQCVEEYCEENDEDLEIVLNDIIIEN